MLNGPTSRRSPRASRFFEAPERTDLLFLSSAQARKITGFLHRHSGHGAGRPHLSDLQRKPAARKDKIVLLNAGRRVQEGRPKNFIPEEDIRPLDATGS